MNIGRKHARLFGAACLALLATLTAACGGEKPDSTSGPGAAASGSASANADLRSLLPEATRSKGTINVGTGTTYVPVNYLDKDGKTMTGFVPEVIEAMAARLGVKVQWTTTQLASILTGVSSNRYDAGIIFADTKEREQAASFLALYKEGRRYLVRADYTGPETPPCGAKIGVNAASVDATRMPLVSKENCESKGQPAYAITAYPTTAATELALRSSRVDFVPSGAINLSYMTANTTGVKALGPQLDPSYYSMAVRKDNTQLMEALKAALQAIIGSGDYGKIMKKWNVSDFVIDKPLVDVATS